MSPERTLHSTFWAMIAVQTIGSVDPIGGPRKLPSPKQYVAIFVLWSILSLATGTRFARAAGHLSILVLVSGAVLGPFGPRLLAFLNLIGSAFSLAPASAPGGAASSAASPSPSTGGVTA